MAERANWEAVSALIKQDGDVNAPQADGTSALIWAAYHDRSEVARQLLAAGASADVRNRYGITPISQAAANGNVELLGLLLDAGADANAAMPEGDTPLMHAARSGNVEAVRLLLEHGADVAAQDEWRGDTALMWAAGENHPEIVRLLVDHGAGIDAASTAFDWEFVKQVGVASHLPRGGLTPLLHAARENSIEAAEVLLELGADPNVKDPQGLSVLRVAITNSNLDMAKLLLDHGADPNEGALTQVASLRAVPWVRAGRNRSDEMDSLSLANLLLDLGADIHFVPEVGMVKQHWVDGEHPNQPPLFLAGMGADLELMQLLIDRGASIEESVKDDGATMLMAALGLTPQNTPGGALDPRQNDAAIVAATLALELGSDINATKDDGMTALHMMASQGPDKDELVQFLLDNGARLDIKDSSNRLPIDVAKAVPAVRDGPPPPMPPPPPVYHETTVEILRVAMAAAGVEEDPYVAPPPKEETDAEDAAASADEGNSQ